MLSSFFSLLFLLLSSLHGQPSSLPQTRDASSVSTHLRIIHSDSVSFPSLCFFSVFHLPVVFFWMFGLAIISSCYLLSNSINCRCPLSWFIFSCMQTCMFTSAATPLFSFLFLSSVLLVLCRQLFYLHQDTCLSVSSSCFCPLLCCDC